jgi:hypothetical protein
MAEFRMTLRRAESRKDKILRPLSLPVVLLLASVNSQPSWPKTQTDALPRRLPVGTQQSQVRARDGIALHPTRSRARAALTTAWDPGGLYEGKTRAVAKFSLTGSKPLSRSGSRSPTLPGNDRAVLWGRV